MKSFQRNFENVEEKRRVGFRLKAKINQRISQLKEGVEELEEVNRANLEKFRTTRERIQVGKNKDAENAKAMIQELWLEVEEVNQLKGFIKAQEEDIKERAGARLLQFCGSKLLIEEDASKGKIFCDPGLKKMYLKNLEDVKFSKRETKAKLAGQLPE